ncbi:MAG: hypothetical protein ABIT01_11470 [Thermoanaerobaculia bacterium]
MGDQKYRHSGYTGGSGGGKDRSGGGGGAGSGFDRPTRLEGSPKGRGADPHREEVFLCKRCNERSDPEVKPDSLCKKCGAPLHACVQCRFFDTTAPLQCRKSIPLAIAAKGERNECAEFEPGATFALRAKSALDTPDQARSAFDKLFK